MLCGGSSVAAGSAPGAVGALGRAGGLRGQNQKMFWGIILAPKMIIYKGQRSNFIHWGVPHEYPEKGGVCGAAHAPQQGDF